MRDDHRLALLYAGVTGLNALSAWSSVVLVDLGASPTGAAAALAALPATGMIAGPLWGLLADRSGAPRALFTGACAMVALTTTVALRTHDLATMTALLVLLAATRAGQTPLLDAATLATARARYGRLRAAGSAAFVVAMVAGGLAREVWPRGPFLLPCLGAWLALTLATGLPRAPVPTRAPGAWRALLLHPVLAPLLLAAWLHGLGLTTYDALFPLLVQQRGLSPGVAGLAIGWGAAVEVAVLWTGSWWLDRLGARRLLLLGMAAGPLRWWATGWLTDGLALGLLQGLHGLTFGAFWLAAVRLVADLAPPGTAATAVATLLAATFGVGATSSLLLASAWLATGDVPSLLGAMAAPALLGTALAAWALRGDDPQ